MVVPLILPQSLSQAGGAPPVRAIAAIIKERVIPAAIELHDRLPIPRSSAGKFTVGKSHLTQLSIPALTPLLTEAP